MKETLITHNKVTMCNISLSWLTSHGTAPISASNILNNSMWSKKSLLLDCLARNMKTMRSIETSGTTQPETQCHSLTTTSLCRTSKRRIRFADEHSQLERSFPLRHSEHRSSDQKHVAIWSKRCVVSGFRHGVNKSSTLLWCYAAYIANYLQTFRDNLPVPSFWTAWTLKMWQTGCSATSVPNYQSKLRYSSIETWWHTVTHGRGSEGETCEWSG